MAGGGKGAYETWELRQSGEVWRHYAFDQLFSRSSLKDGREFR